MTTTRTTPILIQPEELQAILKDPQLIIVDLSSLENYRAGHIPGAIHLDFDEIVCSRPPVSGLLPEPGPFSEVLSRIGFTDGKHIVAYDDAGCGKASRFLWSLTAYDIDQWSLLNGGKPNWLASGLTLENGDVRPNPTQYHALYTAASVASSQYIRDNIENPDVALLDARTYPEYLGDDVRSRHGGHIPGARHYDWMEMKDSLTRLVDDETLRNKLQRLGITPDKEVIVYCQTHHRSALSYVALRHLGYPRVKGYPGAWSDWGNQDDLPIASGKEA